MIVEQIIEFESRGLGPYSRTCTPKTGYFMIIQKTSRKNKSSNELLFAVKNSGKNNALYFPVPPSGQSHLQNLTQKRKILNVFFWP